MSKILVGVKGCHGTAKRKRGPNRPCAQKPIYLHDGKTYCWYHHPDKKRVFGERGSRSDFGMRNL